MLALLACLLVAWFWKVMATLSPLETAHLTTGAIPVVPVGGVRACA